MSDREFKRYLEEFEQFGKEINSSKETAKKFLMDVGIIDETGELTGIYAYKECTHTDTTYSSASTAAMKK